MIKIISGHKILIKVFVNIFVSKYFNCKNLFPDPGVLLEFSTNKERRIELNGFSGVKDEDIQDSIKLKWIINWLCLRSLIFMSS